MKEHQNHLFVAIPEGAKHIEVDPDCILWSLNGVSSGIDLPPGQWQLVATTDNVSEEQAAGIVERWHSGAYTDYERHLARVNTALESLATLLASLGIERAAILKRTEM